MNFLRTFFLLALPVTVSFLSGACSSAAAVCEQSACKSGNVCVNDGTEDKCRLPCAAPADCPAGYKCSENPGPGGDEKVKSFCTSIADVADGGSVPNISKIAPKDKGQWGFPCNPSKGYANNPDCDSEQNFWCYAETPTDGEAYCTQYQCGNVAEKKLNNWLRQAGPIFDTSLALEFLGWQSPDVTEGLAAHREKRKPAFPPESNL